MRRIDESRSLRAGLEAPPPAVSPIEQILSPERGRTIVVPVREIEWIEGDTYYVRVRSRGVARLLRERLSKLEAVLDPLVFHRTHRSALVRVELIREVRAESQYSYSALLATGDRVPVSRERVKSLQNGFAGR